LATVAGLGEERVAGIRDSLAGRLARVRPPGEPPADEPPVAELLDVDREYRAAAVQPGTPRVAPRVAHGARRPALHRPVLEHRARPRAGAYPRLGGTLRG